MKQQKVVPGMLAEATTPQIKVNITPQIKVYIIPQIKVNIIPQIKENIIPQIKENMPLSITIPAKKFKV